MKIRLIVEVEAGAYRLGYDCSINQSAEQIGFDVQAALQECPYGDPVVIGLLPRNPDEAESDQAAAVAAAMSALIGVNTALSRDDDARPIIDRENWPTVT